MTTEFTSNVFLATAVSNLPVDNYWVRSLSFSNSNHPNTLPAEFVNLAALGTANSWDKLKGDGKNGAVV